MRGFAWLVMTVAFVGAVAATAPAKAPAPPATQAKIVPVVKSDAEWKKLLTAEQYRVLRTEGTEIAFTGKYWDHHAKGTYVCAGCGLPLFASSTKFDSATGWPSFWQPIAEKNVHEVTTTDYGIRIEVECARCGGHLGHVFDDGPRPTGLRYCINSASLAFVPAK